MDIAAARKIEDLEREVKARGEILDAITRNIGEGNSWLSAASLEWRTQLRDFAGDSESHQICRSEWKTFKHTEGVVLFLQGNFATAYFDDAAILWGQAEDDLPMHHVMDKGDPPHRTCIHLVHLVNWIRHLAENCIPVEIVDMQFVETDRPSEYCNHERTQPLPVPEDADE